MNSYPSGARGGRNFRRPSGPRNDTFTNPPTFHRRNYFQENVPHSSNFHPGPYFPNASGHVFPDPYENDPYRRLAAANREPPQSGNGYYYRNNTNHGNRGEDDNYYAHQNNQRYGTGRTYYSSKPPDRSQQFSFRQSYDFPTNQLYYRNQQFKGRNQGNRRDEERNRDFQMPEVRGTASSREPMLPAVKDKPSGREEREALPRIKNEHSRGLGKNNFSKLKARRGMKYEKKSEADDYTHRERLEEDLTRGVYECMVCCENIRRHDFTWHCLNCFHIFHLNCIKKWATSSAATVEGGWQCPACRNTCTSIPKQYFCFCGKQRHPEYDSSHTPHSCGRVCGRKLPGKCCSHHCILLCHPGPCPSCTVTVSRTCYCGKSKKPLICGKHASYSCDLMCGKPLSCKVHYCQSFCHEDACEPCKKEIEQVCYCGRNKRKESCTEKTSTVATFCCEEKCEKKLSCDHHNCKEICHENECPPCQLLPESVTNCPCGKSNLKALQGTDSGGRLLCTDPIPTCGQICQLPLKCGQRDNPHLCRNACHEGPCPSCPSTTPVKCLCSASSFSVKCSELEETGILRCEKRCNKRKNCGRHKCLNLCCVEDQHTCLLTCNKRLSCGLHNCPRLCHKGNCFTCENVSFDDLTCYCGDSVILAPVPCGTRPPECTKKCTREHSCGHTINHPCHSDESCPPCVLPVEKWCFGKHEKLRNVPCFLDGMSCGNLCNTPLPCGRHTCQKLCHEGVCGTGDETCRQPCFKERMKCGHMCGVPCHDGDCPDSICKAMVTVACPCGNRKDKLSCSTTDTTFSRMTAALLATKMHQIQEGQTVNVGDVLSTAKSGRFNSLDCDEKCARIARNKQLANAFGIEKPDARPKALAPSYSDYLKEEYLKNSKFVEQIYDKLVEIVKAVKDSSHGTRTFSFPPMNRGQRKIIHELAQFFYCETQSFDQEPRRNVMIIASKEKSEIPSISLMAIAQREVGQRKVPVPVLLTNRSN